MKQKEVIVGGTYWTKVSGQLVQVVVHSQTTKTSHSGSQMVRFYVRRVGEQMNLPKARPASALWDSVNA